MAIFLGSDIGGTNTKIGLFSPQGDLVYEEQFPSQADQLTGPGLLTRIAERFRRVFDQLQIAPEDLAAIGLCAPGIVDSPAGVLRWSGNLPFRELGAADFFYQIFHIPTFLVNDATSAALAEYRMGAAVGYQDSATITLGTGIGCGIVIQGKAYPGFNGVAGELGHLRLYPQGRSCTCGRQGCFEAYASSMAVRKRAQELAQAHPDSLMVQMVEGDLSKITGKTPFEAAQAGDPFCQDLIAQVKDDLALGLSNLINLIMPEMICVGGGMSLQGDAFIQEVGAKAIALSYVADFPTCHPRFALAQLGVKAGLYGAFYYAKDQLEQGDRAMALPANSNIFVRQAAPKVLAQDAIRVSFQGTPQASPQAPPQETPQATPQAEEDLNLALLLEYDGRAFRGFQYQDNAYTVQEALERAWLGVLQGKKKEKSKDLEEAPNLASSPDCPGSPDLPAPQLQPGPPDLPESQVSPEPPDLPLRLLSCSRTDKEVSALGHVVNFRGPMPIPPARLPLALNAYLQKNDKRAAPALWVQAAKQVPASFHARFDCLAKTYCYQFWLSRTKSPLRGLGTEFIPWPPNRPLALQQIFPFFTRLLGEQDFQGLQDVNAATTAHPEPTIRRLDSLELWQDQAAPERLLFRVRGSGFLYHMVRILAGCVLGLLRETLTLETIEKALVTGERKLLQKTMPGAGLTLEKVFYPEALFGGDGWEDYLDLHRNPPGTGASQLDTWGSWLLLSGAHLTVEEILAHPKPGH